MANGTPVANPVWADIQGMFAPFASQMMWRLNLGSYQDVSANAQIIWTRITTPGLIMPPPPFPPLTAAQIQTFKKWMDHHCPETAADSAPAAVAGTAASAPAAVTVQAPVGGGARYP